MAKRYEIKNKNGKLANNGGQIAIEYLQSHEKCGLKYTFKGKGEKKAVIRRALKRIPETSITVPCEPNSKKVRSNLEQEIKNGKVSIGHAINPKTYVKMVIKNDELVEEEFTVEGRKNTLYEIREKLFEKHKKFMGLHDVSYFEELTLQEVNCILEKLDEIEICKKQTLEEKKAYLKKNGKVT